MLTLRRRPRQRFAFAANDTVGDLLTHYPDLARILSETGIDTVGGGDETLASGCARLGLAVSALLERLALAARKPAWIDEEDWSQAGLGELVDHLVASHHAYLAGELPRLVCLAGGTAERSATGGELHRRLVDFASAVACHLEREESELFPVCVELEHAAFSGSVPDGSVLRVAMHDLESGHLDQGAELMALAELVGRLPADAGNGRHRAALREGLAALAADLDEHHRKEEEYLLPGALHAQEVLSTGIFRHHPDQRP